MDVRNRQCKECGESIQGTYKRQEIIMPVRMYSFISRVRAHTLVRVHKRESTINKCLIKKLKNYGKTAKNEAGGLHTTD